MTKPSNPNVIVPAQFAVSGTKTDFSAEKIQSGFDSIAPDILAGDNLNKFIDDVYKSITYSNAGVADLYRSAIIYDNNETYGLNSLVFYIDANNNTTFYRSKVANNVGNPVTDSNYWAQVQLGEDILTYSYPIGMPKITLDFNNLPTNSIWLEGAEVSRTTYAELFAVYGTTYGIGDGSTTFNLPDFRNRAIWGSTTAGYISAGLPDITGYFTGGNNYAGCIAGGAFTFRADTTGVNPSDGRRYGDKQYNFAASRSNPIYGASNTVQPPAIKVRVYTRYA